MIGARARGQSRAPANWTGAHRMTDISELESRMTAAMDRIAAGIEALGVTQAEVSADEFDALQEALEAERNANAQLEERVLAIKEKQDKVVERLENEVERLRADIARTSRELTAFREVNARLRDNNAALRRANAGGEGDAALIALGAETELEALRLQRQTDRAELDLVLSELKPLVEGMVDA